MNISSVVVTLSKVEFMQSVLSELSNLGVEVATKEDNKIVVLIEAKDLGSEIAIYKKIESIYGVNNAAMIYSYQDLDSEIKKANNNKIGEIVRKIDKMEIKDIVYNGDLKGKL